MIFLATFCLLVGAVLAQRFKIMILIPATVMILIPVIGVGIAQDQTAWWIMLSIAAVGGGLQGGYIAGLVMRHVTEAPGDEPETVRAGTPVRRSAR